MIYNEVRRDYLLDRCVVIATARSRRPIDFAKKERPQKITSKTCPLCYGNEHLTPPALLVYVKAKGRIRKTKDQDGFRNKNWLVRIVPNLYPAFNPPQQDMSEDKEAQSTGRVMAVGHHEVLVESPNHSEHPSDADMSQLTLVVEAYIDRLRELSGKKYVRFVSIFRNHGLEAGASLSHAHSQLIATPFIPETIRKEIQASNRYYSKHERCVFCDIIRKEAKGSRAVLENQNFFVFAPYASINPMEFWIVPKKHQSSLLQLSKSEVRAFAEAMKKSLRGLKRLVNDPPYNYGFHQISNNDLGKHYHWHLEVYPKLAIWAGFEKSAGVYINTVTPEAAAKAMRDALKIDKS